MLASGNSERCREELMGGETENGNLFGDVDILHMRVLYTLRG